ncbi:hypothetical protein B4065_1521 [Caldibacillus thermoamylovorans]|nr:hypothetical protein B4065_1521 [Caldibacillus thermoamylovorans]
MSAPKAAAYSIDAFKSLPFIFVKSEARQFNIRFTTVQLLYFFNF